MLRCCLNKNPPEAIVRVQDIQFAMPRLNRGSSSWTCQWSFPERVFESQIGQGRLGFDYEAFGGGFERRQEHSTGSWLRCLGPPHGDRNL